MEIRTRFAPSPTGYMHIGNLRTALYTYLIAKKGNGKFILRIEDTDQERYVEGAVDIIYRTLRTVGLNWDEGPDVGGPVGPYIQSERMGLFKQYAEELVKKGEAYYCFCDKDRLTELKAVQEASGVSPMYDRHCRNLSQEEIDEKLKAGVPYVIRQKIPETGTTTFHDELYGDITVDNSTLDDQVLLKTDGMPTYNFANVVDDHLMGITHVVRGNEYLASAPKYNLLYKAFGWEVIVADGHDFEEILKAYAKADEYTGNGKPIMILFKSDMGHGVDFMAGTCAWHGKAPSAEQCEKALAQLEETLGDF